MQELRNKFVRAGLPRKGGRSGQSVIKSLTIYLVVIALSAAGPFVAYNIFLKDLPSIRSLKSYCPPVAARFYSDQGELIGEYFTEKRYVLPIESIPPFVVNAFIAAEDSRFFEHPGVDYIGILRALLKNIEAGEIVQGGSTITQQVAKSLLLSSERTLRRKIREAVLSLIIEKYLTKEEILFLYLNQIYLGHGAYGVEAAALNYFNKHVYELSIAEAAMLAGIPRAPSRYSPATNPDKARLRQHYVLEQMKLAGFLTDEELQKALTIPVQVQHKRIIAWEKAPYFTEFVRQYVENKYGRELLYEGGLSVYTTVNLEMQEYAQKAVEKGLRDLDKRQGFRGSLSTLDADKIEAFCEQIHIQEVGGNGFEPGKLYTAVVERVHSVEKKVSIRVGRFEGTILLEDMRWARRPTKGNLQPNGKVSDPSQVLSPGNVIKVVLKKRDEDQKRISSAERPLFKLEQQPLVEAALLCIENKTGYIKAMVGGRDFLQTRFNRSVQSRRQPGSAFKPIIYAAAIDKNYIPSSIILDTAIVHHDDGVEHVWKPSNYEDTWYGPTTLRKGLIDSRNVVTVRILMDIGIEYTLEYARNMGITSEIYPGLSMALGASGVSLMELTSAYSIFPNQGLHVKPVFITRIVDRHGKVLEEHLPFYQDAISADFARPPIHDLMEKTEDQLHEGPSLQEVSIIEPGPATLPELSEYAASDERKPQHGSSISDIPRQVISPETAYVMTNLLQQVLQYGTGRSLRGLGRPAGGKTGTTNNFWDAWFVGFTPSLTTGVWVGFDEEKPLGRHENGAHAAGPIWLEFMKKAEADTAPQDFPVPPGVEFAWVDPETGLLVDESSQKGIRQAFKAGTIPEDGVPMDKTRSDPRWFFKNINSSDKIKELF